MICRVDFFLFFKLNQINYTQRTIKEMKFEYDVIFNIISVIMRKNKYKYGKKRKYCFEKARVIESTDYYAYY